MPAPTMPLSVENGLGSQYGNYAAQEEGETRGPSGERCVLFNWDRPFTVGFVIRVQSQSCESKENPGRMVATEVSRLIVPVTLSNLKDEDSAGAAQ
jgi:hypothetical protein